MQTEDGKYLKVHVKPHALSFRTRIL